MTRPTKPTDHAIRKNDIHVALLRGVNVGGKNKLPMNVLTDLFVEAGCRKVQTYVQSGNVVFAASPNLAKKIPTTITRAIHERLGLRVPIAFRTSEELDRVTRSNPYMKPGIDAAALHVMFLADDPDPARVRSLDPDRSPGDLYQVRGRHIYLCYPNGVARSKLTNAYFDAELATMSTARNWRTVLALAEMARG